MNWTPNGDGEWIDDTGRYKIGRWQWANGKLTYDLIGVASREVLGEYPSFLAAEYAATHDFAG